jgi:hypothetical protein
MEDNLSEDNFRVIELSLIVISLLLSILAVYQTMVQRNDQITFQAYQRQSELITTIYECSDGNPSAYHDTICPPKAHIKARAAAVEELAELMRIREKKLNLRMSNLAGMQLAHLNLSSADFRGSNITNTDFHHSDLKKARFIDCDLRKANFDCADMRNTLLIYDSTDKLKMDSVNLYGVNGIHDSIFEKLRGRVFGAICPNGTLAKDGYCDKSQRNIKKCHCRHAWNPSL